MPELLRFVKKACQTQKIVQRYISELNSTFCENMKFWCTPSLRVAVVYSKRLVRAILTQVFTLNMLCQSDTINKFYVILLLITFPA